MIWLLSFEKAESRDVAVGRSLGLLDHFGPLPRAEWVSVTRPEPRVVGDRHLVAERR
jgi:hypothetical protein